MISLEEIFEFARRLPAEERRDYLDAACDGDDVLRARIVALLADAKRAGVFFGEAEGGGEQPPKPPVVKPVEGAGSTVGRYRLLRRLGEGGFGTVYLAEQREPVRRQVAVKIIKLGMDSKQIVERFKAERQALALMDHPSIASVYDGGTTQSGRPYFVMEHVKGKPLTRYCDEKRLGAAGRLRLFGEVCSAVQHAHQKGIIHRDLKPSNILVAEEGGVPNVRVIDFGIAKALQQPLTDGTLFTRGEQVLGTPLYMSPEQAEGAIFDVDTRSDIYSLGVILYELLTGQHPISASELLVLGVDEMRKMIRERIPPKPSSRVSSTGADELTTIAERRGIVPVRLCNTLRGDLDWITMKALEKERDYRYATTNALREDIEHYLRNEPVNAGPPSPVYRINKFLRRYRWQAAAVLTIVLLIVVGGVLSSIFAVKAKHSADLADANATEALVAKISAEREEKKAREARAAAETQAAKNWRMAYLGKMRIANQAWNLGLNEKLSEQLSSVVPSNGEEDRRELGWRFLQGWLQEGRDGRIIEVGVMCSDSTRDGRYIAFGRGDGSVVVREFPTRQVLRSLRGNWGKPIRLGLGRTGAGGVFLTERGQLVLFGSGFVRVCPTVFSEEAKLIVGLYLARDESSAILVLKDGRIGFIDCLSGQTRFYKNLGAEISACELSPGGDVLAVGLVAPRTVLLKVPAGFEELDSEGIELLPLNVLAEYQDGDLFELNRIQGYSFSKNGRLLFTRTNWNLICRTVGEGGPIWSLSGDTVYGQSRERRSPDEYAVPMKAGCFLGDGNTIVTAQGPSFAVWRIDQAGRQCILSGFPGTDSDYSIQSMDYLETPDGPGVAVLAESVLVEVPIEKRLRRVVLGPPDGGAMVGRPAVSPDSRTIVGISKKERGENTERLVFVWDSQSGKLTKKLLPDWWVQVVKFSPHSKNVYVGTAYGPELVEVDLETWQIVRTIRGSRIHRERRERINASGKLSARAVVMLAFDPSDKNRVAVGHYDGSVAIINLDSGEERLFFDWFERPIQHLGFSPDGRYLFANTFWEGTVLWDFVQEKNVYEERGYRGPCSQAFSPDGTVTANGGWRGFLVMDDLKSGESQEWFGHGQHVSGVAFSDDRRSVISISCRGELFFWDRQLGEPLLRIDNHFIPEGVGLGAWMEMSPDNTFLVSRAADSALRVLRFPDLEQLSELDSLDLDSSSLKIQLQDSALNSRLLKMREEAERTAQLGKAEQAEELQRSVVRRRLEVFGPSNIQYRHDAFVLATILKNWGKKSEFEETLHDVYKLQQGFRDPLYLSRAIRLQLGWFYRQEGRAAESVRVFDEYLDHLARNYPGWHSYSLEALFERSLSGINLREDSGFAKRLDLLRRYQKEAWAMELVRRKAEHLLSTERAKGVEYLLSVNDMLAEDLMSLDTVPDHPDRWLKELFELSRLMIKSDIHEVSKGIGTNVLAWCFLNGEAWMGLRSLHLAGEQLKGRDRDAAIDLIDQWKSNVLGAIRGLSRDSIGLSFFASDVHKLRELAFDLGLKDFVLDLLNLAVGKWEEVHGPDDENTLACLSWLGHMQKQAGNREGAERAYRVCFERRKEAYGLEPKESRRSLYDLAMTVPGSDEAESLLRELYEQQLKVDDVKWLTHSASFHFGKTLRRSGKNQEAIEVLNRHIEWLRVNDPANDKAVHAANFECAHGLIGLGEMTKVERIISGLSAGEQWPYVEPLLRVLAVEFERNNDLISAAAARSRRGEVLARLGRMEAAAEEGKEAVAALRRIVPVAVDQQRHAAELTKAVRRLAAQERSDNEAER